MAKNPLRLLLPLGLLFALSSCSMYSTAREFNGHVGPDGRPVFVMTATYLGVHLVGLVPMVGDTTIEAMVEDATDHIEKADAKKLRLVETESVNFWYGVPPLSWIFSPVITSVTFEYEPTDAALAAAGLGPATDAAASPGR